MAQQKLSIDEIVTRLMKVETKLAELTIDKNQLAVTNIMNNGKTTYQRKGEKWTEEEETVDG